MLARCARMAPATGRSSGESPATLTTRACLSWATASPFLMPSVSEPLAPFTVTEPSATVADTPWGSSTGFFATRDMMASGLRHHADHFAALADRARLAIGHDALRGRHDGDAQSAQHLGQRVLATVAPEARAADSLEPLDDRPAVVILELHGHGALAAVLDG